MLTLVTLFLEALSFYTQCQPAHWVWTTCTGREDTTYRYMWVQHQQLCSQDNLAISVNAAHKNSIDHSYHQHCLDNHINCHTLPQIHCHTMELWPLRE